MSVLYPLPVDSWNEAFSAEQQVEAVDALEGGKIIFMQDLGFDLHENEQQILSPKIIAPGRKNISYNPAIDQAKGCRDGNSLAVIKPLMVRYLGNTRRLIEHLFPGYEPFLTPGRTSYRPTEVKGRPSSSNKDDTRLHVDAFPSTPTRGKRILRFFTNINPAQKPRCWKIGADFTNVARTFLPQCKPPLPGSLGLLHHLRFTKARRSLYDHYMLTLHDRMKADPDYQAKAEQASLELPAGSSWIVYTDQVSHAAMSGQYLLEQTFYLPLDAMKWPAKSPLGILESELQQQLV